MSGLNRMHKQSSGKQRPDDAPRREVRDDMRPRDDEEEEREREESREGGEGRHTCPPNVLPKRSLELTMRLESASIRFMASLVRLSTVLIV